MTVRVVVVEDQQTVRAGLVLILNRAPGIEVAAEAADGEAAVRLARELRPDVVLMDVQLPLLDGVAATGLITAEGLAEVLVLTTFDFDDYLFGALRAGAAGFLLKDSDAASLVSAIRAVAAGQGVVAPSLTRRLLAEFARTPAPQRPTPPRPEGHSALTPREREVLTHLGAGLSNAEIAETLGMAEATAKTHVSRILAKLGLRSRVQAALAAQTLAAPRTD